jgi:hypothetical protein
MFSVISLCCINLYGRNLTKIQTKIRESRPVQKSEKTLLLTFKGHQTVSLGKGLGTVLSVHENIDIVSVKINKNFGFSVFQISKERGQKNLDSINCILHLNMYI